MKLFEMPVNTLVELRFNYIGANHRVKAGLLYKSARAVYVSAIKNAGKTIPAIKLKNIALIYKTEGCLFLFKDLALRSVSFNGQNLYVIQTDQEAIRLNNKNAYRLFIGTRISARIILPGEDGANYISCILKDICVNGMGILSREEINKDAKIEISFRTNEDENQTLIGNIIHAHEFTNSRGFLYGCEFDEPNDIIGKYVARKQEEIIKRNQGN